MPSRMTSFKKYLQFLSFDQQILKINSAIDDMRNCLYLFDEKANINRKYSAINELKTLRRKIISENREIIMLLCVLFILIKSLSLYSGQ